MVPRDLQFNLAMAALAAFLFAALSFINFPLLDEVERQVFHLEQGIGRLVGMDVTSQSSIGRPSFISFFELSLLLGTALAAALLFSRWGEMARLGIFLVLLGLPLAVGTYSLTVMGTPLKVSYTLGCVILLYISSAAKRLSTVEALRRDALESKRLLGLNYQKQGLLDLAFEKFKECLKDRETKDLIYHLGLDYEERGMGEEALSAYRSIEDGRGFRDVAERISRLESAYAGVAPTSKRKILSDSFIQKRKRVGRYQVLEEIGKGTMGLIYKALDPKINRLLAIKVIRFSDDFEEGLIQEIRSRFFREAEIAGRLSHPGIVTIHDVGEDGDLTYMAMEYLEGRDLSFYCRRPNLLPLLKVLDVTEKVAEALAYAHKENVIHRDIKPANIMLLKSGEVKVTDFGIAKAVSSSKTKTGVILGTPNYMSPEQIMGRRIDARTDIFSLGVLLFQLLTGDLPFHGENLSSLLYQITQSEHPSVRQYNSRLPKACDQIIAKALAKDSNDRFQSAAGFAKYLKIFLSKANR